MSVTGRSPKHPRTESDHNAMDVGVLMEKAAKKAVEKAADRFSACMDAKIESIWERMHFVSKGYCVLCKRAHSACVHGGLWLRVGGRDVLGSPALSAEMATVPSRA